MDITSPVQPASRRPAADDFPAYPYPPDAGAAAETPAPALSAGDLPLADDDGSDAPDMESAADSLGITGSELRADISEIEHDLHPATSQLDDAPLDVDDADALLEERIAGERAR